MDHPYITDHDFVGRYRRGELRGPDLEDFEVHLIGCSDCQDALEADQLLARHVPRRGGVRRLGPLPLALAASTLVAGLLAGVLWVELGGERARLARLEAELAAVSAPVADAPVFHLAVTRGGVQSRARLRLSREQRWFTLELEVPQTADVRCKVRIEDAWGTTVWDGEATVEEETGTVRINLLAGQLEPGAYTLVLSGREAPQSVLTRYGFEVAPPG